MKLKHLRCVPPAFSFCFVLWLTVIVSCFSSVQIKCVVETRDWSHAFELKAALEKNYPGRVFWKVSPKLEEEAKALVSH